MAKRDRPMLLIAAPDGAVFEHPSLEMAIDNGLDMSRVGPRDLIPVPEGWDLMAMPGTRPIGYDASNGTFVTVAQFTTPEGRTFAPWGVAVHPPPGYVRLFHPAAEYRDATHPDVKLARLAPPPSAPPRQGPGGAARGLPIVDVGGDEAARPGLPLWAYTAVGMTARPPVSAPKPALTSRRQGSRRRQRTSDRPRTPCLPCSRRSHARRCRSRP